MCFVWVDENERSVSVWGKTYVRTDTETTALLLERVRGEIRNTQPHVAVLRVSFLDAQL